MFDALTDRLGGIFKNLTGRGALSEKDVETALREIRVALLEADVALTVVKDFIAKVRVQAVGESVIRSVTPGQQVVKIVHDGLVEMLSGGEGAAELLIDGEPPTVILMAGLQGSGKTTTSAKLGLRLRTRHRKKVLMASLDVRRPAAMEQLKVLGEQAGVDTLPIVPGQRPADIARRAQTAARLSGYDVLILDTAGRTTIDEQMMAEAAEVAAITSPHEVLLVADALTGQDAVETARRFNERLQLTGLILTRMDGDGRGGAALSMRAVTGVPIKFLGVGERIDGIDVFDPRRVAGRILGQGDIVSLVEKAAANVDQQQAEKLAKKLQKGQFDLDDLRAQLVQLRQIGGMGGVLGMLPGVGKIKQQISDSNLDDRMLKRQEAIILSMTPGERARPDLLNGSRKRRIAKGAGVDVSEINRLLKMHRGMADMVKSMGKGGGKGGGKGLGAMMSAMGGARGLPPGVTAEHLKSLGSGRKVETPGVPGPGLPGLPGAGLSSGLPGLPGAGAPAKKK